MLLLIVKAHGQCSNIWRFYYIDKTKWDSEWDQRSHLSHHYKSIKCGNCGKKNWVKVDFDGSGHDFLFKREVSPIESLVRKVKER